MKYVASSLLIVLVLMFSGCASQKPLTHDDFNKAMKNREYNEAIVIINTHIVKQPDKAKSYCCNIQLEPIKSMS